MKKAKHIRIGQNKYKENAQEKAEEIDLDAETILL